MSSALLTFGADPRALGMTHVASRIRRAAAHGTLLIFLASLAALSTARAQPSEGAHGLLLVANKGAHTMGIIDPLQQQQIAVVAEDGITGHELVAAPDGKRAFVPIYGNSGVGSPGTHGQLVRVIDIAGRKIVGTVDFGKGVRPHCAMFGPKNGLLYVSTERENSISIIDPNTLKIVGSVPTGQAESHMFTITHDGKRGFSSNVGPGTVSVLDLENNKLVKVIPVSKHAQRISISVDDHWVFTSDQTKPELDVIDTMRNEVTQRVELPGLGYGTAPTPNGEWLVVAVPHEHIVAAVNLKSMKVEHTMDVPRSPQEVLVRPDGAVAYVSCDASKKVAVIDLKEWKVSNLIDAGAGVDGLAWASGN